MEDRLTILFYAEVKGFRVPGSFGTRDVRRGAPEKGMRLFSVAILNR